MFWIGLYLGLTCWLTARLERERNRSFDTPRTWWWRILMFVAGPLVFTGHFVFWNLPRFVLSHYRFRKHIKPWRAKGCMCERGPIFGDVHHSSCPLCPNPIAGFKCKCPAYGVHVDTCQYAPKCDCGCESNTPTQHKAFCKKYGALRGAGNPIYSSVTGNMGPRRGFKPGGFDA